ncbi:MAG: CHAT domain-containing protein, partial [Anaerolineae bacterium]
LAPDFVIFDANWNLAHTGELVVKASGDSAPLIFDLLPKSPGAKSVAVDFRQNDRLLGTVGLQVEVVSTVAELGAAPAQALSTQAVMTMPDRDLPPPQLELRIKAADSAHTTFEFTLHSKLAGFNWKSMGTHQFAGQPAEEMKSYFKRLNDLARQTGGSLPDKDKQTELKTLGENLFFDAFPEALQRALWAMPARITSLIITSDEPWIPWELARIFDPETRAEGDFLCSRFTVARWLAGDGMTATLPNRGMTAIIPSTNLIYTAAEYEALQELWPDDTLIALTDAAATTRDVISRLKDSRLAGIVHVASHGAAGDDPAQSTITLSDGKLRPTDISRSTRYTRRPLIFFNACESGRTGFALAGLGGWAERFVQAGAGAFVGALWEVNDRLAAQFAAVFYEKLFGGAALGDAFTAARTAIRDAAPNNPTWLAYVLYGEPLSLLQAAPE